VRSGFGQTVPQKPSRTMGLVLQCKLHQKSAPQTNSNATSWHHLNPARLPSGTKPKALSRCDQDRQHTQVSIKQSGRKCSGRCAVGFRPNLASKTSRTMGLVLQCKLYQKSAPQTKSKATSWHQTNPARLPSNTKLKALSRCDQYSQHTQIGYLKSI